LSKKTNRHSSGRGPTVVAEHSAEALSPLNSMPGFSRAIRRMRSTIVFMMRGRVRFNVWTRRGQSNSSLPIVKTVPAGWTLVLA
jgi:hypothetical protein